jgi:hypothetical protein
MRPSVPWRSNPAVWALVLATVCVAPAGAASSPNTPVHAPAKSARPSSQAKPESTRAALQPAVEAPDDLVLKGGDEGTVFRTLTVQGEDRIHIEVERPVLRLDMDPAKAPGLDRGTVTDVLDRTTPDLEAPLLASTAREGSPWVAHPWLSHFPSGASARR